jgi:hypothetical protein
MTDKREMERVEQILTKECYPANALWIREFIARTWPAEPPTVLSPGYRLETDGKMYRIVANQWAVIGYAATIELALQRSINLATEEAKWKPVKV